MTHGYEWFLEYDYVDIDMEDFQLDIEDYMDIDHAISDDWAQIQGIYDDIIDNNILER